MRMLAKQLNADPAVMGTIVAAVFLCGLFLTATPLLFKKLADEALLEAVTEPEPQLRNISVSLSSRTGASALDDPFRRIRRRGEAFRDVQMPESVSAVIQDQTWVADSPRFIVDGMPGSNVRPRFSGSRFAGTQIRLRYQEGVEDHVSIVGGALPQPHEPVVVELGHDCLDTDIDEDSEEFDCADVDVEVFEVAVTAETLDFLPVQVGGMLLLTPDVGDAAYFGIPREDLEYAIALRISGLIEIDEPEDDYWYNDPRLFEPRLRSNADFTFVFATGLMSAVDYGRVLSQTGLAHWNYQWRYFVDAPQLRDDTVDQLTAALTNLQAEYPSSSFAGESSFTVNTKLPTFVAEFRERRDTTLAMMSTSIAGLFIVTVSLILMLSALASERQRAGLVLLRNRGASRLQMGTTRVLQGLILSLPTALLAFLVTDSLISASSRTPGRLTGGLVAASTGVFVLAAAPVIFRKLGMLQERRGSAVSVSEHRLVWELLAAVVAVGSVVVVRRRGVVGLAGREPDLLLALTPVLLALAVGLLVLRVYPHLIRFLAYLGSRRRGLTAFVGFRRVLQQPAAARLPMLVMLIAVAVATFANLTRVSINEAQVEASWRETGAAYRVSEVDPGNALTGLPNLTAVDSYEAEASGVRFPDSPTVVGQVGPPLIDVLFIEPDNYSAVTRGTPADPHFPTFMTDSPRTGSENDPILAMASTSWDGAAPSVGEVFGIILGGTVVHLEVGEVQPAFAAMRDDGPAMVVDIGHLDALVRSIFTRPTVIYVRAAASAGEDLATVVSDQTFGAVLTDQASLFREIHDEKFTSGVDRSLTMTFWLAMLLAAVAAVSSLALASAARRRDLGFLRTQGLSASQSGWLTVIELLPAIVVASVAGALTGVGMALVLEPAITLAAFTSGTVDPGFTTDPVPVALVTAGVVAGLSLVGGIFGYVRRREDLGGLLRVGGE